jgi:SAM-dependent methyltransferase
VTPAPIGSPSDSEAGLAEALDNLEAAPNYAGWVLSLVRPYLGRTVLEVGAGHGIYTDELAGPDRSVVATELSPDCVRRLRERFAASSAVTIVHGDLPEVAPLGPFDTAVLINVLEHIADDDAALRGVHDLLQPGGRLLLWVPALPALYSDFDRRIGHVRRYIRGPLRSQVEAAGFVVSECRYVNLVGAFAWLVLARVMGVIPTRSLPVRVFDRWFVPILRRVESRIPAPVGQAVFIAALKAPK